MGERVKARYLASANPSAITQWYSGVVAAENDDGSVAVRYDDGDYEGKVLRQFVKPLKT